MPGESRRNGDKSDATLVNPRHYAFAAESDRTELNEYKKLAASFDCRDTEIYYGHPSTCKLLEHWVLAGTYMATYTRITTMESANESGRHAAAALIFKLRQQELEHTYADRKYPAWRR